MMKLFADLPEALENSVEIARRCSFILDTRKPILPRFTGGSDDPEEAEREEALELRRQAVEGSISVSQRSAWRRVTRKRITANGWNSSSRSSSA